MGIWGALEFEREMTPGSHHTLVTGPSCLLPCPLVTAWEFNTSFCRKPRQTTVSFIESAQPQGWTMLGWPATLPCSASPHEWVALPPATSLACGCPTGPARECGRIFPITQPHVCTGGGLTLMAFIPPTDLV